MGTIDPQRLQRDMIALRDGDREAFSSVYDQVWPVARRFAARLLDGPEATGACADADDAAQQALINVFSRIMAFDPERPALPWILGITYNECRTLRQQRRRQAARQLDIPLEEALQDSKITDQVAPEEALVAEELKAALREIMGSDSLRPIDVETLWAGAGRDPRPNIPAATFRKRFQRAMARLKTAWERRHEHL